MMSAPKSTWQGKTALITGASSGIGESTAYLLASKGMEVILVARRTHKLSDIQKRITATGGKATVFPCDLSKFSERESLCNTLKKNNLVPDVLVNNAGLAWYGYFHKMPWDVAYNILSVNVEAVTHLTRLFLPCMIENNLGRIINVGSIAGKLPEQGIAVYSASKAYLDAFTIAIFRETRGTGVVLSILRAGPVKTEFFEIARNQENGTDVPAERLAIPSELVAKAVWSLINNPRRVAYVPFYAALSPLLEIFFSTIIDAIGPILLRLKTRNPDK